MADAKPKKTAKPKKPRKRKPRKKATDPKTHPPRDQAGDKTHGRAIAGYLVRQRPHEDD